MSDETFIFHIDDLFRFADGRTVLTGSVEGGEQVVILPGLSRLFVDGALVDAFAIEPEMLVSRPDPIDPRSRRAVATQDAVSISISDIKDKNCWLEGPMRSQGHRDLVGIDSPPDEFIPDNMTLGPRLPEGWDGDAWTSPDESSYFLRAWNKQLARYALGRGMRYTDAREALLEDIKSGGRRVEITASENKS
jgi:hypothetical protein